MPPPLLQAVLLVDGYNVIGSWSCLKKTLNCHGLEAARQELVESLINYSAFQGYATQVVFDAHSQNTRLSCENLTPHLAVYYTDFGQTADTYIEKFCASFKFNLTRPAQRLIVATSDRAQQLTVVGYGAEWMSSQQLASDVEFTARRVTRHKRPPKQSRGRFLFNSLDAQAQQRLAELRRQIK
ncbi:MAG TPA: NYN domain-containing protein [Cyanophyceae cyanobacterium]